MSVMKESRNILEESGTRENPFKVPEGYFENLAASVAERRGAGSGVWTKVRPYLAIAASFALIALVGTAVLKRTATREEGDDFWTSGYYSETVSGQNISDEDIINYLIYAGFSDEELNELTENEDF